MHIAGCGALSQYMILSLSGNTPEAPSSTLIRFFGWADQVSALIRGLQLRELVNMVYTKKDDKMCYIQSKAADLVVSVCSSVALVVELTWLHGCNAWRLHSQRCFTAADQRPAEWASFDMYLASFYLLQLFL